MEVGVGGGRRIQGGTDGNDSQRIVLLSSLWLQTEGSEGGGSSIFNEPFTVVISWLPDGRSD